MDVVASFFDPSDNGFDLVDTAQIVALVFAIVGAWAGFDRWRAKRVADQRAKERSEMRAAIEKAIVERTQPIQPDANGGKSMPDLHAKVDILLARQTEIALRMDRHIENHGKVEQ